MIRLKDFFKENYIFPIGAFITETTNKNPTAIPMYTYQVIGSGKGFEMMMVQAIHGCANPVYAGFKSASSITEEELENLISKYYKHHKTDKGHYEIYVLEPDDVVMFHDKYKDRLSFRKAG